MVLCLLVTDPGDARAPKNIYLYLYLYLRLMGYVGQSAENAHIVPSSLFLNALIDGASTTSCGNLLHSLTIRELKKFCLIVVLRLGLNSFNECPLSPLVTSASSKKFAAVDMFFFR